MYEIKKHRRLIIICGACFVALFISLSWIEYNYQNTQAKKSLAGYIGDLRVSYKPSDLVYEKVDGNYALSTKTLKTAGKTCSTQHNPAGSITRIDKSKLPAGISIEQLQAAVKAGRAKEYPTYWLVFSGPQAACSNDKTVQQQQLQAAGEAQKVFNSVQ